MKDLLRQGQRFRTDAHPEIPKGETFVVKRTAFEGGGTAHGPHDVYPDGHHVWARPEDGGDEIDFYQSGCFTNTVPPEKVRLQKPETITRKAILKLCGMRADLAKPWMTQKEGRISQQLLEVIELLESTEKR